MFRCPQRDLLSKYGQKTETWAVVTGGSDGIGLSFCHELARQGFNIVMISRNPKKIDEKILEINDRFPHVKTRGVTADLSKMSKIEDYNKLVEKELKDIDIGMLVLNAGVMHIGCLDMLSDASVEATYAINILHVAYMTKALSKTLLERD